MGVKASCPVNDNNAANPDRIPYAKQGSRSEKARSWKKRRNDIDGLPFGKQKERP